jgi:ADP-heptose:LPS heptosyltransferase
LADHSGLPIVFTAAPQESAELLAVSRTAAQKHSYWADLPLEDLFALIERSRLFVGNDSGPTHAAAMLHKPVVTVWGSSNWNAWRPWNCDYELVRSDLPCMPCPGYTCRAFGEPRCILDIPVERVFDACLKILARHGSTDPRSM